MNRPHFLVLTFLMVIVLLTVSTAAQAMSALPFTINHSQSNRRLPTIDHLPASPCINGRAADTYPCQSVDLLAHLPLSQIGGGEGADIWGWTDLQTGHEYALVTRSTGTSFVDISNPTSPIYLGNLPPHDQPSSWRDVEVYGNYAYMVTEDFGGGMQVFDLTQLRDVTNPPITFAETTHYDEFNNAHTIAINQETGYAYAVGTSTCGSGLHMVDIRQPANPQFAGCYDEDGYTHETQCVVYHGPDADHNGREICFASNEDTLTLVDVTDKSDPQQISRTSYSGVGYTHQGWLTADHAYFLLDDEIDEITYGHNSRTYIWDVRDLDAPFVLDTYTSTSPAIDHNLYIHNGYVYQANYRAGLRILDGSRIPDGRLHEVAYFDIYPANDAPAFNGAWGNYPFFASGVVIVGGIEQGLFVLKPTFDAGYVATLGPNSTKQTLPGTTAVHTFTLNNLGRNPDSYQLSLQPGNWPTTCVPAIGSGQPSLTLSPPHPLTLPSPHPLTLPPCHPVILPAGESAVVTVEVEAPDIPDVADTFTLTATSVASPTLTLQATGTTETAVHPNLAISGDTTGEGFPGEMVIYRLTITNIGDYRDTYTIAINDSQWPTTVFPAITDLLEPGASQTIDVLVTAGDSGSDTAALTVTSNLDPDVGRTIHLTTAVTSIPPLPYASYLPLHLQD